MRIGSRGWGRWRCLDVIKANETWALAIRERELDPRRLLTVHSLNNLGELLHAAARSCFERALVIYKAQFLPQHPDIARIQYRLAEIVRLERGKNRQN